MTDGSNGLDGLHLHDIAPAAKVDDLAQLAADQRDDTLPFYELEGQILGLWDRLNELKLEIAVLEAQPGSSAADLTTASDDELASELEKSERECLKARAEYMLKNSVVEDTIIAGPILNAIHAGENASGTERTLKPLLGRRDALEMASTNMSSTLQATIGKSTKAGVETLATREKNRGLATELLALASKIDDQKNVAREQPELEASISEAKEEAATARKQWRIMKSVVSAVVAGSGVDWAKDPNLQNLVLDPEDEGD